MTTSLTRVLPRILYLTDPETFASLVLINSAWRSASQKSDLYAYHLSRCPSFSASNNVISGPYTDEILPILQRQFAQEVKRNLFEGYLRPRQTMISLISTTTSSSAAFPGGEAFDFTFSPKGRWCLALSSSRIFVIDVASPTVSVQRELKVLRRPLSAAVLDDGSRLAVLSTDHKVNVYSLSETKPKFLRSVSLDNPPHTITLSARGEVLAAAYDGGVEVHSLAANAVATDQRSVKCDRVDHLAFSSDGSMLLGTTQTSKSPATVILSAPYFTDADHDMPHHELVSHMWTSQILFPNSSRDCSHATLLPHQRDGDSSWTLTYDGVFESFRAVRTDDLRNGTTYFTGPKPSKSKQRRRSKSRLVPCTLPTITERGELVAAGFLGNEVWMYGVPEGLDTPGNPNPIIEDTSQGPSNAGPSSSTSETTPTVQSGHAGPELERLPRWQVLVDKYRNVFAKGRRVAKVPGVTGMSWVGHRYDTDEPRSISERLVIAAPGGVSGSLELEPGEVASVDGGRLVILDFDRAVQDGRCEEMTIEVGDKEPEMLEEENVDMATEVAIVRRRTVAQRRDVMARVSVAEALARPSAGGTDVPAVPPLPESSGPGFGLVAPPLEAAPATEEDASPESPTEGVSLEEVVDAFDGPYSHTNPRSRNTLYRSATAVAANRMRNTARIPDTGRVEYRRTDGTELPHESDADNWVPPPPPYTPDADAPLPHHLRMALASGAAVSQPPVPPMPRFPQRSQTTRESSFVPDSARRRSSADIDVPPVPGFPGRPPAQRQSSNPTMVSPQSDRGTLSPTDSATLSVVSSLDQRSPPATVGPAPSRRRPVSAYDHRPSGLRSRMDNRPTPAGSTIIEPNPIHRRYVSQPTSLPSSPTNHPPEPSNLTLSGSNLQQRLDYPLPPPPPPKLGANDPVDRRPSPLDPVEIAHPSNPPSPSSPVHPPVPSMPSAYQLNNLQNRYNTAPIPASLPMVPYLPYTQTFPTPAPPRGAMGALGRAPSVSRYGIPIRAPMEAPARALSRNNSRGSSREGVASAPNLLRPQTRRLDTIYSIASRGDDRADVERETVRPTSRFRTRSEGRLGGRMGHRESRWMGRKGRERRAETPGPEDLWREREVDGEVYERGEQRKKSTRCIVM